MRNAGIFVGVKALILLQYKSELPCKVCCTIGLTRDDRNMERRDDEESIHMTARVNYGTSWCHSNLGIKPIVTE